MKQETIKILYCDRSVLVCHKPAGLLSEGDAKDSLPHLLQEQLSGEGESNGAIFPVHRLDRETEGVMVFARTQKAAASLSRAITEQQLKKEYLAILCGIPQESAATLTDLLFFDRARNKSFVVNRERKGVKKASLDYTVWQTQAPYSLLHVRLHTGRTHQIRVQFASRKLPLRGDRKYGAPAEQCPLMLCAYHLQFPHPDTNEIMSFTTTPTNPQWQEWTLPR
jgi:23S rRNA pseudouridine1911/1915/1917 synthase